MCVQSVEVTVPKKQSYYVPPLTSHTFSRGLVEGRRERAIRREVVYAHGSSLRLKLTSGLSHQQVSLSLHLTQTTV